MVADGRDNRHPLHQGQGLVLENVPGQQGAVLCVMGPVHGISDVVEQTCDFRQLLLPLGVAQFAENIGSPFGHQGGMGRRMVREPQDPQVPISFFQQLRHLGILLQFFI